MIANNQPPERRFAILWHSMPSEPRTASEGESLLVKNPSLLAVPESSTRVSHFDLMLEFGDSLRTWELLRLPTQGEKCTVRRLPDHRLHYLDYEGPLTENRGHVIGWERGKAIWSSADEDRMEILLFGERLTAKLLIEPENVAGSTQFDQSWILTAEIWQLNNPVTSESIQ